MTDPPAILAAIAREFIILNYIEAGLWMVLSGGAAWAAGRQHGVVRRDLLILSLTLFAFGLSDIVETRTGAWYRPWWLAAWKAACLAVMVALLVRYIRRRHR